MSLYVGLISGTSADGIDAALIDTSGCAQLIESHAHEIPKQLRASILSLAEPNASRDDIDALGELDAQLGELLADAALALVGKSKVLAEEIVAIGSHGQTIRHRPGREKGQTAFTLQIGDPNIIAERTGIATVTDFRRRDMAAGGQGAPLVPAFHRSVFGAAEVGRVIVNLGGIANITVLAPQNARAPENAQSEQVIGYDTGPANGLMDAWVQHCLGKAYDYNGEWAAQGQVQTALLQQLKAHPYFKMKAPKSTGREEFSFAWLMEQLSAFKDLQEEDVQATLLQLTVESLAESLNELDSKQTGEVFLCGGGARNKALVNGLKSALPGTIIETTKKLGIHPDWVEAAAFAWLASQTLAGLAGNEPAVTGAKGERVLGAVYS